jgi:hypothetical protein
VTSYGGTYNTNGHGNVVVAWRAADEQLNLFAYDIPLNPANCPGLSQDLVLIDVQVTPQLTFDQFNGIAGANGTYKSVQGVPFVHGTIYVSQDNSCANNVSYSASTATALQGDYNCSWLGLFASAQGGGTQPAGFVPPDLFEAITFDDAINLLKVAAGLEADERPAGCPAPGTQGVSGAVVGDANCSGFVDAGDTLMVALKAVSDSGAQDCAPTGEFILLD